MKATDSKTATATRIGGNLYDVTYPHTRGLDSGVPSSYLLRLVREGYRVTVDQSRYRIEGEPKTYVMDPVTAD
jgi:hypothetical protein